MHSIDSEIASRFAESKFMDIGDDTQTIGKRSLPNISLPMTESSFLGDKMLRASLANEVQDLIEKSKLQRKDTFILQQNITLL